MSYGLWHGQYLTLSRSVCSCAPCGSDRFLSTGGTLLDVRQGAVNLRQQLDGFSSLFQKEELAVHTIVVNNEIEKLQKEIFDRNAPVAVGLLDKDGYEQKGDGDDARRSFDERSRPLNAAACHTQLCYGTGYLTVA